MEKTATRTAGTPCDLCPWRVANHGKRHPGGFYDYDNLRRLWNQIREGVGMQSCHPTDPGNAEHRLYAGAKAGAKTTECVGSTILLLRELRYASMLSGETTSEELSVTAIKRYLAESGQREGITSNGIVYHCFTRALPRPIGEGAPLPAVNEALLDSPAYGRPDEPRQVTST